MREKEESRIAPAFGSRVAQKVECHLLRFGIKFRGQIRSSVKDMSSLRNILGMSVKVAVRSSRKNHA